MSEDRWIKCADQLPPNDEVVLTQTSDHRGCRNKQRLKRHNNLWFFPDGSMYVYYQVTHWNPWVRTYK